MGRKFEEKMNIILKKGESKQLLEDINTAKQMVYEIIYYIRVINLGFKVKTNTIENSLIKTIRLIKDYQANKLETKRFIESCDELLKEVTKDYNFLWENRSRILNGVNNIIEKSKLEDYFEADNSSEIVGQAVDILPKMLGECFSDLGVKEIELLASDGIPVQNLSKEKYLKIKESNFGKSLYLKFK